MRSWSTVPLYADGAVQLASVRRNYFRVKPRTTLKKLVCMASLTMHTTFLSAGSCLQGAVDARSQVAVACWLRGTANAGIYTVDKSCCWPWMAAKVVLRAGLHLQQCRLCGKGV